MKLVIGGIGQGKLAYVREKMGLRDQEIWRADCGGERSVRPPEGTRAVYRFHAWFRNQMEAASGSGTDQAGVAAEPEKMAIEWIKYNEDLIIICDEVGNGIVPADAFEREYRERLGRLLCELAQRAEHVDRVICGIAQRLK